MKLAVFNALLFALALAMDSADQQATKTVQKRDESGEFSCYTAGNIWDFSALCPNINYPIDNTKGLSMMENLYFALASTDVPDNTVYNAQENIICTVNGPTGDITATIGAGLGGDLAQAGAEVSFTLTLPNFSGSSLCMFTEGTGDDDKNVADPITLKQARDLLYTMLTTPNADCKTCARIPIRYPQVKDGTAPNGGMLKIDRTDANTCLGKCVGPASFSTASPSPSTAAGLQLKPLGGSFSQMVPLLAIVICLLGAAFFNYALL